eukprot:SAG31_NODE_7460_length_1683_cov_1.960859_1_plen_229_part_00
MACPPPNANPFGLVAADVSLRTAITIGELPSTFTVSGLRERADNADKVINLRIPGWAVVATTSVLLNGETVVAAGTAKPGAFLQIKSDFKPGDTITASFGMAPRFEKLNDNRTAYNAVGSLHYGPYALVALTDGDYALKADLSNINDWLKLAPAEGGEKSRMVFIATGSDGKTMQLLPLNRVADQNYTAHLNISDDATQCLCGEADKCAGSSSPIKAGTDVLNWDSAY